MQIVEAAEWVPSGMGNYLWHFTVIYNAEKSLKLARAVAEADNRTRVQFVVNIICTGHHALVDGAAAMENLLLMATELGLGSCWINQLAVCERSEYNRVRGRINQLWWTALLQWRSGDATSTASVLLALRETCDVPEVRALLTEYGVPEDHIVVCSAAIGYIEKETPAKPRHEGLVSITE